MNTFHKITAVIIKVAVGIALAYLVSYFTKLDLALALAIYTLAHLTITDIMMIDLRQDVRRLEKLKANEIKDKIKDLVSVLFSGDIVKAEETKTESRKVPVKSAKKIVKKVAKK